MRPQIGIALAFLLMATSSSYAQQNGTTDRVSVGVVTAARKPIAKSMDFVGRVEAVNRVEIRARVTGYLESVDFKEGDVVQAGASLYKIERGLFQAAVGEAGGALDRSKAAKVLSEVQLQRAEDLYTKNVGSAAARDQARAADDQAKGTILIDQANLDTAKINLGYTDIVAPVTGKIGRTNVTKGNVVGPETGPLTVIVSQDPMYVTFPVSQREFLRLQQAKQHLDVTQLKASLSFADLSKYDLPGTVNFVDVTVNRGTDTVLARASFPNPDGALVDGQFVHVSIEAGKPVENVIIPQSALIADQQGTYVFVVDDGKAAIRRIKTGGESGGTDVVVDSGLSGGEQVIVDGLQSVRPGSAVIANPVPQLQNRS
ncbi:efflux transporter periplasmic adaptor subunit [Hyphomicrobium methylovorum]|uniref:efflux RND transporter periplasmic adaptor subunit n=1 Tax=Hyphomicrobium methylovorum TaxID=84 RepID=UPI0015E70074|nr:efflux RND transporter periplasmic adaptor subunit [Hyphomicrobium methylovorum]MBA2125709.1 efflux transporter periplasmic adaptor subunit [Hyphomicrobium methylovorum]